MTILVGLAAFLSLRVAAILTIFPFYDEMVQLYMTDDIAHFRNFPVYFYVQHYMGPLESYFLAPFIRVFGFSYLAARWAYQFFYLAFSGIVLSLGRRFFDRQTTLILFVLLAVPAFSVLYFSAVVAYWEIMTVALVTLVFLLKTCESSHRIYSLALGFISGIAFWCNSIFVVWLVPIGVSLVWLVQGSWKRKIPFLFLAGFLAGLFPIWIHGFQTGTFLLFETAGNRFAKPAEISNLLFLFIARLKYFLTTFIYPQGQPWVGTLIRCVSFIPLTLFGLSFVAFSIFFLRSFHQRTSPEKAFFLFILLPPVVLTALYASRNLFEDEGMRYFLPLFITFVFSTAWLIRNLSPAFLKKSVLGLVVVISLGASAVSLPEEMRYTSNLKTLLHFLEENNLRSGVSDLRLAYGLNALSKHEIIATPVLTAARVRSVWQKVKEKGYQFFILAQTENDFRDRLETDPHLKKVSMAGYDIFYGTSSLLDEIAKA